MTPLPRQQIEAARGPRAAVDAEHPIAVWVEQEADGSGRTVDVATVLLTVSECPWRCAMCDLWRHTLSEPTPVTSVPRQLESALAEVPSHVQWIKLYNSGNFFDAKSIPPADHRAIASLCRPFERVIVENHPRLCTERVLPFRESLSGQLEIALGVETVQPGMLRRLNKGTDRDGIDKAIHFLRRQGIDVRAFLLLRPPWTRDREAVRWAMLSLRHLFRLQVRHASLIPVRAGNGWMDLLRHSGQFEPPTVGAIEQAMDAAIAMRPRGVVTVDLWDWPPEGACSQCQGERRSRLASMNLAQRPVAPISCAACEHHERN